MKIKDVCSRFSSGDFISADKIYSFGNYPVYGGNGLRGYTDNYNFDGECAVIGRQGAYSGNVKFFSGKGHMTEHAIVAIGNENNNTRFLAYKFGLMNLGRYAGQSAQPGLSVETLLNLDIDLPSKDNQDKIATVLSYLDNKIELNKKINATLEAMAKTLYDYWFVQFDFPDENGKPYKTSGGKMIYNAELGREIPADWEVSSLEKKILITRGVSYSTEDISDFNGIPMINLASIDRKRNYIPEGLKFFSGTVSEDKKLDSMDMLIACTDLTRQAGIIGSPILVMNDRDYTFSMDLAKLDIVDENIEKLYLYMTLRTDFYHQYIKGFASGTTVLHLNTSGIEWYKILIPPIDLQEKFSKIIEIDYLQTCKNITENQTLAVLRDWLLPMLMNGQVRFKRK